MSDLRWAGGYGNANDQRSLTGVNLVAANVKYDPVSDGSLGSAHTILHEIAHNAGYRHDLATGTVEIRDGSYHVTSVTLPVSGETEGSCGGPTPRSTRAAEPPERPGCSTVAQLVGCSTVAQVVGCSSVARLLSGSPTLGSSVRDVPNRLLSPGDETVYVSHRYAVL